ncbi:MAG: hypothetical protein LC776_03610 [Acidobacteria bacterium]|nr:hypothetical protein [Acidobacteriota bacterium]
MEDSWPSKTDVGCDCNSLNDAANNPDVPIEFDAAVNEFHIAYTNDPHSYMLIRHCPFCGGKAPTSKRDSLFAAIRAEELSRLAKLTSSLKQVGDVIAAFGTPNRDEEAGLMVTTPTGEGMPPGNTSISGFNLHGAFGSGRCACYRLV